MQSSSQITTTNKPTPHFLQAGGPSCRPTNSVRAPKGSSRMLLNRIERDSPVLCLCTGDAGTGELAELMSLAMSRYRCSDLPLDDRELSDA